ncbi:unnamed protein product, partial [Ixodes pacificus]
RAPCTDGGKRRERKREKAVCPRPRSLSARVPAAATDVPLSFRAPASVADPVVEAATLVLLLDGPAGLREDPWSAPLTESHCGTSNER